MEPAVTWAAVGMAAVSNMASWLVIWRSARTVKRNGNPTTALREIKETVKEADKKLDAVAVAIAEVKVKVDGQLGVCAETRKSFAELIAANTQRIYNHATNHAKLRPGRGGGSE